MSSSLNEVAQEAYNAMVQSYAAATAGKPKGYRLSSAEESDRRSWVKAARMAAENSIVDAENGSVDEIEGSWWRLQVEKFDAVTTGNPEQAVAAAKEVVSLSNQLQAKRVSDSGQKFQLESAEFELNKARAALIIAAGGVKPVQGWADSLQCGASDFWSPCGLSVAGNNWAWWLLGAAVVIWYGRKKKWF